MCISLLSALRRLISGVDITPSISRQELFFHFITSLTIYVHLITISHLRQFPSVVYISLYLFIFRFFFHLITPKHYPEHSHQVCSFLIHLFFRAFLGGCSPNGTATFLWHQTHGRPALPTCGPPMAPLQWKEEHWIPLDLGETLAIQPLTHRDHLNLLPPLYSEKARRDGC